MRTLFSLLVVAMIGVFPPGAQSASSDPALDLKPVDPDRLLAQHGLAQDYTARPKFPANPLSGDFDGDGAKDHAVMAVGTKSRKSGIVFLLGNGRNVILGAGKDFGNAGGDFAWMDLWSVHPKAKAVRRGADGGDPPKLQGDAILAAKEESGSGLIYFDGKVFKWYQQGD